MSEFVQKKLMLAKICRIILWTALISLIGWPFALSYLESDLYGALFFLSLMFVAGIGLFYWAVYTPFIRSVKWLKRNGMEHIADDIILDKPALPKSKIYCGQKALFSKKSGVILPYTEFAWMHLYEHHNGYVYEKIMVVHTKDGSEFLLQLERDEFSWLLEKYILQNSPDVVAGSGPEARAKYTQLNPQSVKAGKKGRK